MIDLAEGVTLRFPESRDIEALYAQKNDVSVTSLLGGFSRGYSRSDIADWVSSQSRHQDDLVWIIGDSHTGACLGHAGLYRIDHRIRSAEYAIMIGERPVWGRGIGTAVTQAIVDYGYRMLNLNRIQLTVLDDNARARSVYLKCGFKLEGTLRAAQYKDGRYMDLAVMSIIRSDFANAE